MLFPQDQFDHIVGVVTNWLLESPRELQQDFLLMKKDQLIGYHHSLGRDIRNEFKLWELKWEPQIEEGFDMSPDHPDSISMRIIEQVWENERRVRNIL